MNTQSTQYYISITEAQDQPNVQSIIGLYVSARSTFPYFECTVETLNPFPISPLRLIVQLVFFRSNLFGRVLVKDSPILK